MRSFGGISYSLLTLANLLSPQDIIYPVFGIGPAEYDEFLQLIGRHKNIDPSGIFTLKGPTNHVHLWYSESGGGRTECSKDISPAIPFDQIKPFLGVNGILINMVSGFDITLDTLDHIRMETRDRGVPIHFDFHSLTLGVDQEAKRFRRPLTDWRRWCFMIDSVQMSEEEANGLTAERFNEETLINHLMPLMIKAFVITRGSRGATLITQHAKKLERHEIPAIDIQGSADPTGCGDVFGAAFFAHFLKDHDYRTAAVFANEVAGQKAAFSGLEGLDRISDAFSFA
ncbi:MAG TPA: carbohydrate kinase family protein [Bacteroidota bacterium]|nr:carbohydrate kinase family protein [Bacteroidota bacterium]